MRRPSEKCIYCESDASLSKEHIFGQWLKPYVKSNSTKSVHFTSLVQPDPGTKVPIQTVEKGKLSKNWKPHLIHLKIVCTSCNNTWMSEIQESAKSYLLELLIGRWPEFDTNAMSIIASWATMVTMSLEFADINTLTATQAERTEFKVTKRPGSNWQVYVGLCDTRADAGSFWHRAGGIYKEPPKGAAKLNAQTTTFYFGKSFFHVVSAPESFVPSPPEYALSLGIRQFWPIPNTPPTEPFLFFQTGVQRAATEFWERLGVDPRPHFGMLDQKEFIASLCHPWQSR